MRSLPLDRPAERSHRPVWHDRWYAGLADRHAAPVDAVLRRLARQEGVATQQVSPRTGLGAAVVLTVAGLGARRSKHETRLLALAIEAYDRRVFTARHEFEREVRVGQDLQRARGVLAQILHDDRREFEPALDRLVCEPADLGDRRVPECVGFLRAAVAAGVVAGRVDDRVHATLDQWAVDVGLAWERLHGQEVEAEATRDRPGAPPWSVARAQQDDDQHADRAWEALGSAAKPLCEVARSLFARAALGSIEQLAPRAMQRWEPHEVAVPGAGVAPYPGIEAALGQIVDTESRALGAACIQLVRSGGKRIRPRLVLAVAESLGGSAEAALRTGAAIEWVHNASLLVDDLIDQASLRRGHATLHQQTSPQFALGVTGFVLARVQAACRGLHGEVRRTIGDAALALADGQRQELEHTGDFELDRTTYYRIIENKTARLFSCAALVGALEAGAGRNARAEAKRFGHQAGLAFQIVDDVLDYDGDATRLGKCPGTDLRARKVTLPIVVLRDVLSGSERQRLRAAVERGEDWEWVVETMRSRGVAQQCLSQAQRHVQAARRAAEAIDGGDGPVTRLLEGWLERDR